jgi:hypothetical protein
MKIKEGTDPYGSPATCFLPVRKSHIYFYRLFEVVKVPSLYFLVLEELFMRDFVEYLMLI